MTRLSAASKPAAGILLPEYRPEDHGIGIVHIGTGAFHKAHQAIYTDTALGQRGGDWRIAGVSLRSPKAAAELNPQDGRYLTVVRNETGDTARLVGSIAHVLVAPENPQKVIDAIADPAVRVVTLTVTEKAYGMDRSSGGLDLAHEAVSHDLAHPDRPKGVAGFLVAGLRRRRQRDAGPLAILSCDNLAENGRIVARLVGEYAGRLDGGLAGWIAENIRFPSSMVDRITPATTARTLTDARHLSGLVDEAAIETEPFSQWVIEDDFPAGRPEWETGGALFVADVAPYEKMKLRLLNGTHSLLAYAGFLAGHETIAEAVRDEALLRIAERQMVAAAATLPPVPGMDLDTYRADLIARFANRAIRHLTYQIAMDGTEKLPQRILAPASETLANGGDPAPFAFALAAWMRYCLGADDAGNPYALHDPRQEEIARRVESAGREAGALHDALAGLFPEGLAGKPGLRDAVVARLHAMLTHGMKTAISTFATGG